MSDTTGSACELPTYQNDGDLIKKIITEYKTIAVVGISKKEDRDSYNVAAYLKNNGYKIIPVNPTADEILGEKCYKSLSDIPFKVDVIDIFRKPSALPELAEQILSLKEQPKSVWFQIGVVNSEATEMLVKAGLEVVQNRCIMVEHGKHRS